jgi:hypothetical protein
MFVPSLGALLARMMVTELGGRWQPRRNLEQTQVILGDRAWLPFLRVNHFVQSRSSAIENALTSFFSAAQRGT